MVSGGLSCCESVLIKGFIYALSQQDNPPETMLFYNGGAKLTCEGSESLEDLKELKRRGVKILTLSLIHIEMCIRDRDNRVM